MISFILYTNKYIFYIFFIKKEFNFMFIAANWKMNLNKKKIQEFITDLENFEFYDEVKACIFPSFIFIDYLYSLI